MTNIWRQSTGAARRALILGSAALALFAFPFIWILLFHLYAQGFGVFGVFYLILAIPATASSLVASRRGQWWRPDGGKRFIYALYGIPILIILLIAAWAM